MFNPVRGRYARLATAATASALLVGGLSGTAQAASYPHISAAQAKAALPSAKLLPGGVTRIGPVRTAPRSYAELCATKPVKVPLPGGAISDIYYSNEVEADSPEVLVYEIGIITFATTAQANAGAASMGKATKACPKAGHVTESGLPATVTRSLVTKTASGAWKGYRTVDHITITAAGQTVKERANETFLVRGNTLVLVAQIGTETATNGAQSEARRKAVTNLMIKRLSAIK